MSFGGPSTRAPSRLTLPEVGSTSPERQRSIVVLPQPDEPTMQTNSRSPTVKVRSATAGAAPGWKVLLSSRTSSIGGLRGGRGARGPGRDPAGTGPAGAAQVPVQDAALDGEEQRVAAQAEQPEQHGARPHLGDV